MVTMIKIRVTGEKKAIRTLGKIRKNLPEMTSRQMMKWGKILERDMKRAAKGAGIQSFTGTLLKGRGIEWRQRPKGKVGRLFIRLYGIALDSMEPHPVLIRRRRSTLLKWALQSRNFSSAAKKIYAGDLNKKVVHVRRHPFIRTGWRVARPKLTRLLKQGARQAAAAA